MKNHNSEIMKGKICMITGANSGIGKATAIGLAKMGATIVMVCRNENRGKKALEDIKKECNNGNFDLMMVDLSSQKAIYRLIKIFKEKYQQLHVLINNAGVNLSKRVLTEDGIETTFAVNYLAPFLLSTLLLDILQTSSPSRIVNVVSSVVGKTINFENLNGENHYRQLNAYAQSKLALILFTYEFARRIEGTGVTVNSLHPGYVKTNMVKNFRKFVKYFFHLIGLFMKSPKKGAKTSIYLASSPEVEGVSGKYFEKKKEEESVKASYDEELAKRLWNVSVDLTNHKLNKKY
ncbi:MAG: SDR family oxidoreductase [Candidatus Lokiarchaeota archaeon]|nr:SDR family oxidoreductase [Candidatus Lokiarchaeota archaeon]